MKALGIILAGGNNYRMRELSEKRAIAAMPVGGGFRAIDFALSLIGQLLGEERADEIAESVVYSRK